MRNAVKVRPCWLVMLLTLTLLLVLLLLPLVLLGLVLLVLSTMNKPSGQPWWGGTQRD